MFIHGRLCREFNNFDGMLTAKIPSMLENGQVQVCTSYNVGAVEEMRCVVCVSVTERA